MTNGSEMMVPTVLRGFSDEYGSWKIICISRRRLLSSPPLIEAISRPLNVIEPDVGSTRRSSRRAVVDLPQPDSPTSPSVSPRMTSKDTPSTALTAPTWRRKNPERIGKCLKRPSISMIESPGAGWVPCASLAATLMGEPSGKSYGLLLHHVFTRVLRLDTLAQLAPELASHRGVEQARDLVARIARDGLELGI